MNLETKIIIYKFTPQVFTLTRNKLEYLVYIAGKIYLRYLEKKLSIQRTRYTIITPAMTILIIRTNIIYRIKDLFL